MNTQKIRRILILRTEHIGDYILTLPAISLLQKKYPHATIDIVVGPWNKLLAEHTPGINNVFVFENPLIKRDISYFSILFELTIGRLKYLRLFKKLNDTNYDLMVNFSDRKISSFFTKHIHTRKKLLGTQRQSERIPEKERIIQVVAPNKERKNWEKSTFSIGKETITTVENILKQKKVSTFTTIHMFSPDKDKNWDQQNWAKIIPQITGTVILIDSPKERKAIDTFITTYNLQKKAINLAGKLNLLETYYLISKSKQYIGVNSGPMYLAEMNHIPILCLFGGKTDEVLWQSQNKGDKIIKKENIQDILPHEVITLLHKRKG